MTKPITMESETFAQFKKDMTAGLNQLLRNMQEYESDKAVLKCEIKIKLDEKTVSKNGKTTKVTAPEFEHKVSYAIQMKEEAKGKLYGDMVLKKDEHGLYQLCPLTEQLDMFEETAE